MLKIRDTKITMTRGDTLKAAVTMINSDGSTYTPVQGDVVRFAMKKNYLDVETLVYKVIPNETMTLVLDPSDTKELPFGAYVYDIQITYASGEVDTFIDRAIIELTEEVE